MEALKVLRVSGALNGPRTELGREFFDSIKELPLLTELELEACDFDSADAKPLGQMISLKRLSIKDRPVDDELVEVLKTCLLYTSPSPRDRTRSRMPSSA